MKRVAQKLRHPAALVGALYLLALVLWLALAGFHMARDAAHRAAGRMPTRQLTLQDFELRSLVEISPEDGRARIVSTDGDPQMILELPEGMRAGLLVFDATSHRGGGEMVLYYKTRPTQEWSETRKLWASARDGVWYFDLGGRQVYGLRLDTDTAGGVIWTIRGMQLNAAKPAAAYCLPTAQQAVLLAVLPGLAAALLRLLCNGAPPDAGGPKAEGNSPKPEEGNPKPEEKK